MTVWSLTCKCCASIETFLMHLSLPKFNFKHWKNKWSIISFSTEKLTKSKCQVSLAVKYIIFITFVLRNNQAKDSMSPMK